MNRDLTYADARDDNEEWAAAARCGYGCALLKGHEGPHRDADGYDLSATVGRVNSAPSAAPEPAKTPGQLAYEEDCRTHPTYHDGQSRRAWDALPEVARRSWDVNPGKVEQMEGKADPWSLTVARVKSGR